ncbi:MAG TPA: peptide deformylase, partial [Terriglobia bacterium]|nr:peptide deformylase [Terriglobia bacterium]
LNNLLLMIYPIVKYGQPVLDKVAEPVKEFDAALEKLVADMFDTMYAAHGVGLAAPQIGISKSLCVIDTTSAEDPNAKIVLANPVIVSVEGKQTGEEGCLSLPNFRSPTDRPMKATVRAQDIHGQEITLNGDDLLARAFCHEIDHLNGILFIHHLSLLKRDSIRRKVKKLVKAGEW